MDFLRNATTRLYFRLILYDQEEAGHYGEDFTHGFDTQNYPKSQASLVIGLKVTYEALSLYFLPPKPQIKQTDIQRDNQYF